METQNSSTSVELCLLGAMVPGGSASLPVPMGFFLHVCALAPCSPVGGLWGELFGAKARLSDPSHLQIFTVFAALPSHIRCWG